MRIALALCLAVAAGPALAAPIPSFDDPRELLEAIYDDIKASENWETYDENVGFDHYDAFSTALSTLYEEANAKFYAEGNEMGVLDFSPFINGQDSGGMAFEVGEPKIKGETATADVAILFQGEPWETISFVLVEQGADGWKIDDILLPNGDSEGSWRLSEYFADPFIP